MNWDQDITMRTGVGETVKRREFRVRLICDILVRIWFWLIALACSDRSILLGRLKFWSSVLGADLGFRLTPGLPPSEEGVREPPLVETPGGWSRLPRSAKSRSNKKQGRAGTR